jgi:hypothetical protein
MNTTKLFMDLYPMTKKQAKLALESAQNSLKVGYYVDQNTKIEIEQLKKFISTF